MKALKDRILRDGRLLEGGVLKVDSFLNHQIDAELMMNIAEEFVARFEGCNITKVLTVESSGIAPAIFVGYLLKVPVLFAKKSRPKSLMGVVTASAYSFTKDSNYDMCISGDYLGADDRVLFIDDFLANGNAAMGVVDLVNQQGATIEGMGFVIEKSFQSGASRLADLGIDVVSLVRISSLDRGLIEFED